MAIKNVRGRITLTNRQVRVGKAVVIGMKPRILCEVKTGNERWRNEFAQTVRKLGLDVKEVQTWGWTTSYDVTGTIEALEDFVWSPCVNKWEYAVAVK